MAFRDQIRRNRRRLFFFLVAALVLSAIAGRAVGKALLFTVDPQEYYGVTESASPWWAYYPNHVAASLMLLVWVQYVRMRARGDMLLLGLVGARPLAERTFENAAEEMAIAAGIDTPRLWVVEDPSMNAFACGAGDRNAIVVTRGLLERLDRDELQGVLAHETAHIKNGDTQLMTALFGLSRVFGLTAGFALGPLAAILRARREGRPAEEAIPFHEQLRHIKPPATRLDGEVSPGTAAALGLLVPLALVLMVALALGLVFVFGLVARYLPWIAVALAAWTLWKLAGDEPLKPKPPKTSGLLTLAPMGLMVGPAILLVGCVFPFVFWLLRLAVSRNQEFAADATAVELTRYPAGLCSALRKLLLDDTRATAFRPVLSPLAIVSVGIASRRRDESGLPGFVRWLVSLVSTHPPLVERIARLEEMGAPREAREVAAV